LDGASVKILIQLRDGREEHVDVQSGFLEFRDIRYQGRRVEFSDIDGLEISDHYVPVKLVPVKPQEYTVSKAAYALGEANAHHAPKELQEQTITLSVAPIPKGKR
jgi:hypothetical protein